MKILKLTVFVISLVTIFCFIKPIYAQEQTPPDETLETKVVGIVKEGTIKDEAGSHLYQKLQLDVTKGSLVGKTIEVENGAIDMANLQKYKVGDELLVTASKDFDGNTTFFISDYIRRVPLLWLAVLFIACTVFIGGIWGITSLIGMGFSFFVIFAFILPQLLQGNDPITIAVVGAAMIIPVTFYLSHGFNIKTHMAIIGTLVTLLLIGILANVFVDLTHLSGFAAEETAYLQSEIAAKINVRGLLLAGIIISSLGILDDITISQSSVIKEIREANSKLSQWELFRRGMRVGRDHIASLVNTLVLVYAGSSLPLLLLFVNNPHPFGEVINYEIVAEEVVKTLVGSIGLILAVPITTALSVFYFGKKSQGYGG